MILNTARPAFQVAGWVGIWVALVAFYAATAIMTGEVWNHVSPCTQHTSKSLVQGRYFSLVIICPEHLTTQASCISVVPACCTFSCASSHVQAKRLMQLCSYRSTCLWVT